MPPAPNAVVAATLPSGDASVGGPSPLFGALVWLVLLGYAAFIVALLAGDCGWARRANFHAVFAPDGRLRAALVLTLWTATLSTALAQRYHFTP